MAPSFAYLDFLRLDKPPAAQAPVPMPKPVPKPVKEEELCLSLS